MSQQNNSSVSRKPYSKPAMEYVRLAPEETVLAGCEASAPTTQILACGPGETCQL